MPVDAVGLHVNPPSREMAYAFGWLTPSVSLLCQAAPSSRPSASSTTQASAPKEFRSGNRNIDVCDPRLAAVFAAEAHHLIVFDDYLGIERVVGRVAAHPAAVCA